MCPAMDDTRDTLETFNDYYRLVESAAVRRAETRVIGCDYGATSYTTRTQADQMARLLDLGPGMILLDIGSGSG